MIEKTVIIVGGGPAGAACAWRLEQAGIDYLILDKAEFPRFKPCAGWVTPQVFKTLNVAPDDYPHSLAHFSRFKIAVKQIAFRIKTDQYAIRRIEFDKWLLGRISNLPLLYTVKKITRQEGQYILDDQYACTHLVGAGGTNCPVRRYVETENPIQGKGTLIVALEEEFQWEAGNPDCHLWFLQNGLPGYAWYVPKPGGILNIGIGGSAEGLKTRGETLQQHWQRLVVKLAGEGLISGYDFHPVGHSYHLRGQSAAARVGNLFLTGDALGLATLDMGEGIGPAIESGIRAAEAIISGGEYSLSGIARYSLPSLLGLRR